MPYINVKITDEAVTSEQKAAIIAGMTQVLIDVLGKNPATTIVVIEEVPLENWGIAGMPVVEYRNRSK